MLVDFEFPRMLECLEYMKIMTSNKYELLRCMAKIYPNYYGPKRTIKALCRMSQ